MASALVAALLLQASVAPDTEVRTVSASIVDAKGFPVDGLTPDQVVVLENGVAREVTSIEKDTRPLSVIVLVDNTEEISSAYRLFVVDAVGDFLRHLPQDTSFAVWTMGDRPTKLKDFSEDAVAAEAALRRAMTGSSNTLLDALVEGTRDLRKLEGRRSAVVVVTGTTTNAGNRDKFRTVDEAKKNADLFLAVEFLEGSGLGGAEEAYGYVLDALTKETGGIVERPLSAGGVPPALKNLSQFLRSLYRIGFATLAEVKDQKLEIQVARQGVKVRMPSLKKQ